MDQEVNRNFNISVTDNATPALVELARAWAGVNREIAGVDAQIAAAAEQFTNRFRPAANNTFKDLEQSGRGATARAREALAALNDLQAQVDAMRQKNQAMQGQMAGPGFTEEQRASARGVLSNEAAIYGHVRSQDEIAAEEARIAAMRQATTATTAGTEAMTAQQSEAQLLSQTIQELRDRYEGLTYLARNFAGTAEDVQRRTRQLAETEAELQRLGSAVNPDQHTAAEEPLQRQRYQQVAREGSTESAQRQLDAVERRLEELRDRVPAIDLRTNAPQITEQIGQLNVRLLALRTEATSASNLEFRTNLGSIRNELAQVTNEVRGLERQFKTVGEQHGRNFAESFGHAFTTTLMYGTAWTMISTVQNMIGQGLSGLLTKPAEQEQALAFYTQQLGSVTAAQQRYNQVLTESTHVGVPYADILKLDQALAQLGVDSESSQKRFGRSLEQVRQDLVDLSAVPGLSADQVREFFSRSADGANRLLLSLKSARVTTEQEMRDLGVHLNAQGTSILSDADTTTKALLTIIERHYSGLAEMTGQTAAGMGDRWEATWTRIEQTLGKDIFAVAERRERAMLDSLDSPKSQQGMEVLGRALGIVGAELDAVTSAAATAGGQLSSLLMISQETRDALSGQGIDTTWLEVLHKGIENIVPGLTDYVNLVVELNGGWDSLKASLLGADQSVVSATNSMAQFGRAEDFADQSAQKLRNQVEDLKTALDALKATGSDLQFNMQMNEYPLQNQLTRVQRQQQEFDRSVQHMIEPLQDQLAAKQKEGTAETRRYEDALRPIQESLKAINDQAGKIRDRYQALIQPLKDQESELDRIYEKNRRDQDLQDLDVKIARDRALGGDIYSSEGRAAAVRLQDELSQRKQKQGEIDHATAKDSIDQQVTRYEKERDKQLALAEAVAKNAQSAIDSLNNIHRIHQQQISDDEAAIQARIEGGERVKRIMDEAFQDSENTLQDKINAIEDEYKRANHALQIQEHDLQQQIDKLNLSLTSATATTATNVNTITNTVLRPLKGLLDQYADTIKRINSTPLVEPTPSGPGPDFPDNGGGGGGGGSARQARTEEGITRHQGNAMAARGSAPVASAGGVQITFVARDPNGQEWFRQMATLNRDFLSKQLALEYRGARG